MKKNYFKNLLAALLLLCSTVATAYDFEVDGLRYKILSDIERTVEVCLVYVPTPDEPDLDPPRDDDQPVTEVIIPENVVYEGKTYTVTCIRNNAFRGCNALTNVVIPNSVTSIGYYAFEGCTGLTSIEIPNAIKSIGYAAFKGCYKLTSFEIPNSVTNIEGYTFSGCIDLSRVTIPNSVTSIGNYAFENCKALASIDISNSVTSLGTGLFSGCSNLARIEVALGNPVYDSRENCNAIVETETNTLVVGCENTIIPSSISIIGNGAFAGCTSLKNIEIPYGVTVIARNAFAACSALTSIVIPNSVKELQNYAFYDCTSLADISLPNSVITIEENVFENCTGLQRVELNCKTVGAWFAGNKSVSEIVLGDNTEIISTQAFYDCTGLTSVKFSNSVVNIEYAAFCGCSALKSIEIPNNVVNIGDYAFAYCYDVKKITSHIIADDLFALENNVFKGVERSACTLYVPFGAKETYAATDGWSDFSNIVEIEPDAFSLTVTSAGYATLFLDFAAEIPAGVEVYTANAVEDDRLKMQPVEGVIPANTGVIVKAAPGTYAFRYSTVNSTEITDNLFKGSLKDETVKVASGKAAYVLSMVDGEVGMYRAELTGHSFLNNANKAYLLLDSNNLGVYDEEWDTSAGGQLSNGFRFDFGGITGIENVKGESGEVKAIYDLSGRAVENPSKGLYIINGKKVLVK